MIVVGRQSVNNNLELALRPIARVHVSVVSETEPLRSRANRSRRSRRSVRESLVYERKLRLSEDRDSRLEPEVELRSMKRSFREKGHSGRSGEDPDLFPTSRAMSCVSLVSAYLLSIRWLRPRRSARQRCERSSTKEIGRPRSLIPPVAGLCKVSGKSFVRAHT